MLPDYLKRIPRQESNSRLQALCCKGCDFVRFTVTLKVTPIRLLLPLDCAFFSYFKKGFASFKIMGSLANSTLPSLRFGGI